jgi:electron-transferring-flavoprotein dehydrogenase
VLWGLTGMALTGLTGGRLHLPGRHGERAHPRLQEKLTHDELMDQCGWPAIPLDGRLLVTHQDALLLGGKVQAASGYADHVRFRDAQLCRECTTRLCVSMCSGQAIADGVEGGVVLDREKCVHCGACLWNCPDANVVFTAGAGGLHSVEN